MAKEIAFDIDARKKMESGVNQLADMLKAETASTLDKVLYELSNLMKNAYSRSDA